jgi:hypothetical protein
MTTSAIASAQAGTKLATSTDTKITGLTMALPTSMVDDRTQLCLVDAANAAALANPVRTLFAADLVTLGAFSFGLKQLGPTSAPGITAPTWPMGLIGGTQNIGFTNGVFVKSCPTGVSFSLTTG